MKTRETLSLIPSAKLVTLIEAEYGKLGLTDDKFAEHATKVLGFAVNERQVKSRRIELGIASTRNAERMQASRTVIDRITALEQEVHLLKTKLSDLLK